MKENMFKTTAALICGGLAAYFDIVAIPLLILVCVMCIDYISGMIKAYITEELSSRTGIKGILKKLCYMLVVCVAAVVDWLLISGLKQVGITIEINYCFGLIVTIWLIINELISILENLTVIGVPMPNFLTGVVRRLKITVEAKKNGDGEE